MATFMQYPNDKTLAAHHEAGHVTIALLTGKDACCYIFRNAEPLDPETKSWGGQMQYCNCKPTSKIAVAGAIAEILYAEDWTDFSLDGIANEILGYWDMEMLSLSETDISSSNLNSLNRSQQWSLIREVVALLQDNISLLQSIVERLLQDEHVTNGQLTELFTSYKH